MNIIIQHCLHTLSFQLDHLLLEDILDEGKNVNDQLNLHYDHYVLGFKPTENQHQVRVTFHIRYRTDDENRSGELISMNKTTLQLSCLGFQTWPIISKTWSKLFLRLSRQI